MSSKFVSRNSCVILCDTVDGWNPANHLGWCWNPINNGISTTNLNWLAISSRWSISKFHPSAEKPFLQIYGPSHRGWFHSHLGWWNRDPFQQLGNWAANPWRVAAANPEKCLAEGSFIPRWMIVAHSCTMFHHYLLHIGSNLLISSGCWTKNRGIKKNPKWMVKIMENPIKMDDLGGNLPLFLETSLSQRTRWIGLDCCLAVPCHPKPKIHPNPPRKTQKPKIINRFDDEFANGKSRVNWKFGFITPRRDTEGKHFFEACSMLPWHGLTRICSSPFQLGALLELQIAPKHCSFLKAWNVPYWKSLDALKNKRTGKAWLCVLFLSDLSGFLICLPYTSLRKVNDETMIFKSPGNWCLTLPSREHIPPMGKETHLLNCLGYHWLPRQLHAAAKNVVVSTWLDVCCKDGQLCPII